MNAPLTIVIAEDSRLRLRTLERIKQSKPLLDKVPGRDARGRKLKVKNLVPSSRASAPDLVLAAELQDRGQTSDALSMMVSSMVRMVQAGKSSDSRWKAT
jgi:hypothetical protein